GNHNGYGVKVWDATSGELRHHLDPQERSCSLCVTPDGQWLVIGTITEFEIWETDSWQLRHRIARQNSHEIANSCTVSADGRVLAIALSPFVVQLIETATWRPLARLQPADTDAIWGLAFSPDGSQLAVSSHVSGIRLWDLRLIRERLTEIGL